MGYNKVYGRLLKYLCFLQHLRTDVDKDIITMNEKVLKTLEYNKIIEQLADHAASEEAKARCLALRPLNDISQITLLQTQTKDALNRLFKSGSISFSGVRNIMDSLKRLEIGGTLSTTELLRICSLLETAKRAKAFSRSVSEHTDKETETTDSLTDFFA